MLGLEEVLVSFDMVLLFTKVTVQKGLAYISELFPADITALFWYMLMTTYFQWVFYEQVEGVTIGSSLRPVMANFYMERLEQVARQFAQLKPKCLRGG